LVGIGTLVFLVSDQEEGFDAVTSNQYHKTFFRLWHAFLALSGAYIWGRLLSLSINIRLGYTVLQGSNALASFVSLSVTKIKTFLELTPASQCYKVFSSSDVK
jgi:hypothetical protein